jgi:hypothetical protein
MGSEHEESAEHSEIVSTSSVQIGCLPDYGAINHSPSGMAARP